MDISEQDILDLIYDSNALTLGLVEILRKPYSDFSVQNSFRGGHFSYVDAIEKEIVEGACVRIYRPELVSKKFKEYQKEYDALATKITLHPEGFNIKMDYCPWYNFWEYVVKGEKFLIKNKENIVLKTGDSLDIKAHEGDYVSASIATKNTVTYCVYRNRLFYNTGPFYNINMDNHPFFTRK